MNQVQDCYLSPMIVAICLYAITRIFRPDACVPVVYEGNMSADGGQESKECWVCKFTSWNISLMHTTIGTLSPLVTAVQTWRCSLM
jgi:hypothetical protein